MGPGGPKLTNPERSNENVGTVSWDLIEKRIREENEQKTLNTGTVPYNMLGIPQASNCLL